MEILRRNYLHSDLDAVAGAAGITGTVVVQARQTIGETDWLLTVAGRSNLIRGVVGWTPLADANVERHLARISRHPKLKAVRHVLQDEPDDHFMLREDFNRGIALLKEFNLRYDLLIFERHLPQAIEFVDRHPNQVFILDHVAKPRIRENVMEPWRNYLRELGLRPNVFCKISGMVTEADWCSWSEAQLRPYLETVLDIFGAERLMFGSDWPVLGLASAYSTWLAIVKRAISGLSLGKRDRILAGTAVQAYGL